MATRAQNIKLGIFIAAVAALLVMTITLVGGHAFWRDEDVYWVASRETIAGIGPQSAVTLHGVRVGEVAAVELDDSDFGLVWVQLALEPDVALPVGVHAYFRANGLTGERSIDLSDGSPTRGRLAPGSVIPRAETTLEQLEGSAEEIAENAEELTTRANDLIVSIQRLVDEVDPDRVGRLFDDAETVMGSLVASGDELEATLHEGRMGVQRVVKEVVADVGTVTTETKDLLSRADEATGEMTQLLQRADRVLRANENDVRATVRNLRRATQAAEQLTRQLRRRPSLLLRSDPPEPRELP